jgi:tRNA-binding protein
MAVQQRGLEQLLILQSRILNCVTKSVQRMKQFPLFDCPVLLFCSGRTTHRGNDMISIEAFRQIDLRIATIVSAQPHPNADRLLVLQIDLGTEQRQICAGIRNQYNPEELIGKQIVVVANLETAKLRGMESQGMLLAASDDDRVVLLMPEKPVPAGAKIS